MRFDIFYWRTEENLGIRAGDKAGNNGLGIPGAIANSLKSKTKAEYEALQKSLDTLNFWDKCINLNVNRFA
jgi:hypothetical protein